MSNVCCVTVTVVPEMKLYRSTLPPPTTMLPIVFAFVIRYLAKGERSAWWAAALVTFAVSTIHPLIAAMLALALAKPAAMRKPVESSGVA